MSDGEARRFRATVHYAGSCFSGWQVQPGRRTVQGELEASLQQLLNRSVRITAAGRTDAGVHAAGQEIAFDAPAKWSAFDLRRALNAIGPDGIWIERLEPAKPGFHPRFDASGRRYEYYIGDTEQALSPLRSGRIWQLGRALPEAELEEAARELLGEHDFQALCRTGEGRRHTRCRIETAVWRRTPAGDLRFTIVADRFLHRMVRYLVATQVEIALRRRDRRELAGLLHGGRAGEGRIRPPAPAPPEGLYLTGVRFESGWNRPEGVPGLPG